MYQGQLKLVFIFCQTPVLGLGLGVGFTSAWDNHNNHNNHNNPHINSVKGTVLGDQEQWVGIRDKGKGKREKGKGKRDKG